MFNWQGFTMHANNNLSWLRRTTMSCEHNHTAVLLNRWCECMSRYSMLGHGHRTRTANDRMCTVAHYYNISSKADHGGILIVHDLNCDIAHPYARGWQRPGELVFFIEVWPITCPGSVHVLSAAFTWERQANVQSYTITQKLLLVLGSITFKFDQLKRCTECTIQTHGY